MKKTFNALIIAAVLIAAAVLPGCGIRRDKMKRYYPISYVEEIKTAADRYGLDRTLVAAVVKTESGFRLDAVSQDGAVGLMQVLPSTAEWIAFRRGDEYRDGLRLLASEIPAGSLRRERKVRSYRL